MTDSASTPYTIKYIVAGTYAEYFNWLKRKEVDQRAYLYVYNAEKLRGIQNISGFFIGTFRNRLDIDEILIAIAQSKRTKEDLDKFIADFLT